MNGMLFSLLFSQLHPGMHGRGPKASAPASDAAGRGRDAADRASVPRRTASCHVASPESGRRGPTRLKSAPIRRKSAPTRPKSGRVRPKLKKKKKGANAPFYLVISQHSCSGISKEKLNFIPWFFTHWKETTTAFHNCSFYCLVIWLSFILF